MFERFTERARQVVVLAQDEARALRHKYIGTEHLLLGFLRQGEGSAGAEILEQLGASPAAVREEVLRSLGAPGLHSTPAPRPPERKRLRLPPVALLVTGWILFGVAL